MTPRRRFVSASTAGAALSGALLTGGLLLPFALVFADTVDTTFWAVLTMASFQSGLFGGLFAAIRLRSHEAPMGRLLRRELWAAVVVGGGVWLSATLSILLSAVGIRLLATGSEAATGSTRAGPMTASDPWAVVASAVLLGVFATIPAVIVFVVGRGLRLGWPWWDRLRRTKLRWALANALLSAGVAVTIPIGTALSLFVFRDGIPRGSFGGVIPDDASEIERRLADIVFQDVPAALVLFLAPLLVSILIVPLVALIAFPVLRRATKRLEALTTATGALRAGDLGARTEVAGEDEIARLQTDFNAMAADLERSLVDLREERDAVGRLLSARRELVASVSHELRTPLATLRGYLDSALAHGDDGAAPAIRQDLEIMSGEVERLHRLIDDLFILSRAEVGRLPLNLEPIALGPLVQRCVEAAAPLAWNRGRVELVARVADDLPPALVDPERLEQIVRNLLTNAVRHTPPGGLVLVSAGLADGQLEIQVRDTGEGIDPADVPLIWDRFYRAGNAHDQAGAGIGLALVKELTEAMGGSVAAESTPGAGSCFSIHLPRASVPSQPSAASGPPRTP